ncbi:hypothetical protein Efla_007731 [Eimeria flavescens]
MLILAFLFALRFSSAAGSGPPSSSENLLAKGVRQLPILVGNSDDLVQESHTLADFHASGRMVWGKRERLRHSFLAAIVSLGTVLVVAFLVLQCFRALASDHQALYKYRRLSEARGLGETPGCTVSKIDSAAGAPLTMLHAHLKALASLLQASYAQEIRSKGYTGTAKAEFSAMKKAVYAKVVIDSSDYDLPHCESTGITVCCLLLNLQLCKRPEQNVAAEYMRLQRGCRSSYARRLTDRRAPV